MKVIITNVQSSYVQSVKSFLEEEVVEWIQVTDVTIKDCEISFNLVSEIDPFPEDRQMQILTTMFSNSGLEFFIRETGFRWTIA
ncbi:MAG: hypothetical protein ISS02_02800 [Candidatus Portnoybacteria bacterium]|nr:hypothetical protein [Candidatus Portnoybacteria bacterium]